MPKLLKLYQPSCNPCKLVSNFLEENEVDHESVDVTERPDVASDYKVMSVPVTILLDDNGNELDRVVGFNPPRLEELVEKVNN